MNLWFELTMTHENFIVHQLANDHNQGGFGNGKISLACQPSR